MCWAASVTIPPAPALSPSCLGNSFSRASLPVLDTPVPRAGTPDAALRRVTSDGAHRDPARERVTHLVASMRPPRCGHTGPGTRSSAPTRARRSAPPPLRARSSPADPAVRAAPPPTSPAGCSQPHGRAFRREVSPASPHSPPPCCPPPGRRPGCGSRGRVPGHSVRRAAPSRPSAPPPREPAPGGRRPEASWRLRAAEGARPAGSNPAFGGSAVHCCPLASGPPPPQLGASGRRSGQGSSYARWRVRPQSLQTWHPGHSTGTPSYSMRRTELGNSPQRGPVKTGARTT